MTPGLRDCIAVMALKRWVNPETPSRERAAGFVEARVRVTGADLDAAFRKTRYLTRLDTFRRQGNDHLGVSGRCQDSNRVVRQFPQFAFIVDASFFDIQERAFYMNACDAGRISPNRLVDGSYGLFYLFEVVADQGGQQACRPEGAVRICNSDRSLSARIVIEEQPTAPVDLNIHKSRQQEIVFEVDEVAVRII